MTPVEVLIRDGHQHPEQILAALEAGGCIVLHPEEAAEYETVMAQVEDTGILGLTLEEYIATQATWAYDAGYRVGLDVGKDRYG